MRRRILIGIIISVVFVFLVIYIIGFKLNLNQLLLILKSAKYQLVLFAVIANLFTLVLRSWRWRYLLSPIKQIKVISLLSIISIGAMTDMVFPARLGDLVRAYMIGRNEKLSKVAALATIVVERIIDILAILLIAFIILFLVRFSSLDQSLPKGLKLGFYIIILMVACLVCLLFFIKLKTDQVIRVIKACLSFLPTRWLEKISNTIYSFAEGLQAINNYKQLIYNLFLTFFLWGFFAFSNFLILGSLAINLPFYAPFLILVFQIIGVSLPSSPGFIGTYHAAVIAGFTFFEISRELAVSVAIVMHASFFFPFITIGLVFLWQGNFSVRELLSVQTQK